MVWQQWVIIAMALFSVMANIAGVGKPREPTTPALAVAVLVVWLVMVALVVSI